jgi:hypothetical protein
MGTERSASEKILTTGLKHSYPHLCALAAPGGLLR